MHGIKSAKAKQLNLADVEWAVQWEYLYFWNMDVLSQYVNQIRQLCLKHSVSELFVFGSILGDSFSEDSDIDFLVDFSNVSLEEYADNYFDLKFSLESLLDRDVDLLEKKALRNPYLLESIDSTKQLVYEACD